MDSIHSEMVQSFITFNVLAEDGNEKKKAAMSKILGTIITEDDGSEFLSVYVSLCFSTMFLPLYFLLHASLCFRALYLP